MLFTYKVFCAVSLLLYSVLFVESLEIFVNMSIGMKKIFLVHRAIIKACNYPAFYKEKNLKKHVFKQNVVMV
jgi:hypothetical protein